MFTGEKLSTLTPFCLHKALNIGMLHEVNGPLQSHTQIIDCRTHGKNQCHLPT